MSLITHCCILPRENTKLEAGITSTEKPSNKSVSLIFGNMGKKFGVAGAGGRMSLQPSVEGSLKRTDQLSLSFSFSILWSVLGGTDGLTCLSPILPAEPAIFHEGISTLPTCLLHLPLSLSMAHLSDITLLLHGKQICGCNFEGKEE